MENLTSYLTKEGWYKDWNKTIEDLNHLYPGICALAGGQGLLLGSMYTELGGADIVSPMLTAYGILYLSLANWPSSRKGEGHQMPQQKTQPKMFQNEINLNGQTYRTRAKPHCGFIEDTVYIDISIAKVLKYNQKSWRPRLSNPLAVVREEKEIEMRMLASMIDRRLGPPAFVDEVAKKLYGDTFEEIKDDIAKFILPVYYYYNSKKV